MQNPVLKQLIEDKYKTIIDWLEAKKNQMQFNTNIYNSCDIRFSGFKIANVDCNLFPAGFKNLSPQGIENCKIQLLEFAKKHNLDELKTSCKADDIYVLKHKPMQCMLKGVCSKCLFFDETSQNFKYACKM